MAEKLFKSVILTIFVCTFISTINSVVENDDDSCIESKPCFCKLDQDKFIDISKVVSKTKPYLSQPQGNNTYYFYPCTDVKFNYSALHLTVNRSLDECAEGTSLCLYNAEKQSLANLGTTRDMKFSRDIPKSIIYSRNSITSLIKLDCTPNDPSTYFEIDSSLVKKEQQHQLVIFSRNACVQTEHHGLSTGSTLLVLFSVSFGVYLLGGALVLHFLRGARGKEMIPNFDFWTDLPCLVRDGVIFLLGGCNPFVLSTVETYDRI